jgi:hypothetical protein
LNGNNLLKLMYISEGKSSRVLDMRKILT